jgi:hypothetical protein
VPLAEERDRFGHWHRKWFFIAKGHAEHEDKEIG